MRQGGPIAQDSVTRWQRPLRLGLAVFAVVFAIAVYFAIGRRPAAPSGATSPRSDPKAVLESEGGVTQIASKTRQDFQVKYGRMAVYEDGTTRFERIEVLVPQRGGRDYTITASSGVVADNQNDIALEGQVKLTTTDGLVVDTEAASFERTEGMLRIPGAMAFSRRGLRGRSVGATYDQQREVLWLLDRAEVDMTAEKGAPATKIRSGSAGFAQRDRYFRFERDVVMTRGGQTITADGAVAHLQPEADVLQMIELRGRSRVTGAAASALEAMTANDINLAYGEDGATLQRATLAGAASLRLAGAGGQGTRRLEAEWMDIGLSPDGRLATFIAARERVALDLPAGEGAPARRITSVTLDAAGPPDQGITTAHFAENVEFRERVPAAEGRPASERVARSRTLDTVVAPGFGAIEAANFVGDVRFSDGALEGQAPDATYNVAKGALRLQGAARSAAGGQTARLVDERADIDAERIDVALEGGDLTATGGVRSVLKSSRDDGDARDGGRTARRPSMLKADQPTNVTADRLVYEKETGRATYTGDARLWQGETAVQAPTIALDEVRGNLRAEGGVKSTLRLQDAGAAGEARTSVLTAQTLLYEEEERRATYTTDARMVGPEGDVRADRIELYLDESGEALDRAEAYDRVVLRADVSSARGDVHQRVSWGERLTYFARDGRYVMSGPEVVIQEQRPAECVETKGKTLTFYRSADTILIDGNAQRRTESTTTGKCPGQPTR